MTSIVARGWQTFDQRFTAPAPARRIATLRLLVGTFATVFLCVRASYLFSIARLPAARFEPVGVLAGLSEPLPYWVVRTIVFSAIALEIGRASCRERVYGLV